jgi:hypothetical protein
MIVENGVALIYLLVVWTSGGPAHLRAYSTLQLCESARPKMAQIVQQPIERIECLGMEMDMIDEALK